MSRPLNPGEPGNYRNSKQMEELWLSRPFIAQIIGIVPERNVMLVAGAGLQAPIEVSIPAKLSIHAERSAWQRFQPGRYDFAIIEFDARNTPICTGWAQWDPTLSQYEQDVHSGYVNSQAGLTELAPLEPGEWDMRSSGGAYVKGNEFGTLVLAGGAQSVEIQREEERIKADSEQYELNSNGSRITFGDVRVEGVVLGEDNFTLELGSKASIQAGDVRTVGVPTPLESSSGAVVPVGDQLALDLKALDGALGTAVGRMQMDASGNLDLHGNSRVHIDAPVASLTGTQVKLGHEAAVEPVILGTSYVSALATRDTAYTTASSSMAAAATALQVVLAAITGQLTAPVPPASVPQLVALWAQLVPALTAFTAAVLAVEPAKTAALVSETAAAPVYLSKTVTSV